MRLLPLLPLVVLLALPGCADPPGAFAPAYTYKFGSHGDGSPLPPLIPYCTRSLAKVDCWVNPQLLPGPPPDVADGPHLLGPAQ